MTYLALSFVTLDLKGNITARNLSIPMAIFVKTLPATDRNCINKTKGHIGFENIHVFNSTGVNEKGIQKTAIIRSAMARLIKKGLRSVRDRRPRTKTNTTKALPAIDKIMVKEYITMNPICESFGKV